MEENDFFWTASYCMDSTDEIALYSTMCVYHSEEKARSYCKEQAEECEEGWYDDERQVYIDAEGNESEDDWEEDGIGWHFASGSFMDE